MKGWVESDSEMEAAFSNHFSGLFSSTRSFQFWVDWSFLLQHKAHVDLSFLETPFSLGEVMKTAFDLGTDKALGPDCFLLAFFYK